MTVDQDKAMLDQEKTRVQNLLHGMQGVMNAYNSTASPPPPAITSAPPTAIQVVSSTSQPCNNICVSPSGTVLHSFWVITWTANWICHFVSLCSHLIAICSDIVNIEAGLS